MRGAIVALVIIALLAVVAGVWLNRQAGSGAADDPAAVEAQLQQLQEALNTAMERGGQLTILPQLEDLVARHPDHTAARMTLAQTYLLANQQAKAYPQLLRIIELSAHAPQPEVQLLAGVVATKLEKFDAAHQHFQAAIDAAPHNMRARLLLADAHLKQGRADDARNVLLLAIALDTNDPRPYAQLAEVYARQGQINLALDQMQKAIDRAEMGKRETQVAYIRQKSALLRRANRPDEALQVLAGLAPAEKVELSIMDDMATCLAMLGQPGEAAKIFEARIAIDPTDDRVAVRAAEWHIKAGNRRAAQLMVNLLRSLDARHPQLAALEKAIAELPR